MRYSLSILLVVAVVGSAALAGAQTDAASKRADAERFFRAGEQAFNAGQYLIAAQAFEEAYGLLPLSAIAFSAAQAYRLQYFIDKDPPKLKRAVALYRLYLGEVDKGGRRDDAAASLAELEPILERMEAAEASAGRAPIEDRPEQSRATQLIVSSQVDGAMASIDGSKPSPVTLLRAVEPGEHVVAVTAPGYFPQTIKQTAVEGRLIPVEVKLEPMPAEISVDVEAGAEISIDGRQYGRAPLAAAISLPAGSHVVTVLRRGRAAWSRELTVERGEQVTLQVRLRTTTQRKASFWVLGAAGATVVGAGVYGALAFSSDGDAADLDARRDTETLTLEELDEYDRLVDRRDTRRRRAYLLLGVGGALAATGGLLYLIDSPRAGVASDTPSAAPPEDPGEGTSIPVAVTPLIGPDVTGIGVVGTF